MASFNVSSFRSLRACTVAVVVVASLALAGCGGSGSPGPGGTASAAATDPATTSAAPDPTPTPTAVYKPADASGPAQNVPVPVLPEVAKTETKEGLEAFVRYWYATLSYAYETGEIDALEAISEPACVSCDKVTKEVTDWHTEGRWLTGGRVTVEGVDSNFLETSPSTYQAIAQVKQERIDYHLQDGRVKGSVEALPTTADIVIAAFDGTSWKAQTVEHMVK